MAQVILDKRDVDFVLHEQLEVEKLTEYEVFEEFSKKTVNLIISEARNLAIKEMLPALKSGDEEGCTFENGKVTVPPSFQRVYSLYREGEWIAMCDDEQWGGQGMPATVSLAVKNYFHGANFPFMLAILLAHGAGKLVEKFGTEQQKHLYLKKMYSGEWGGTMLLTEPQAGSDLAALNTTAVKNEDGTYSISGNKIFISGGEQDLTDNIIHPVLARIEGAPEGIRGISLFLVPKRHLNDDGSLGEPNDIVCTGIEEKMGIHGSPTCSMTLGQKGKCIGTLLGDENKGIQAMFNMMNEARLDVGMQALGCASASYMNALNYARERTQGSPPDKNAGDPAQVPIIRHPDVRRMLLTMKSCTEGCRSLLYYIGFCEDMIRVSGNPEKKARCQGLIDFLTPVGKGYVTEKCFDLCSLGVQIYGGYGYTKEYSQEQYLRDCKITHIYEGTTGIQAADLIGRKLGLANGRAFNDTLVEIRRVISLAQGFSSLAELAEETRILVDEWEKAAAFVSSTLASDRKAAVHSHAFTFLEVTGDVVMAWMLLWRAVIAAEKINAGTNKKETHFYEGILASARFFIKTRSAVTRGKMQVIFECDGIAAELSENAFGGK